MKALTLHEPRRPKVLRYEDVPMPVNQFGKVVPEV
jgi:NADPH:quinone reductase-like Zn-dependent oxidoreductase